MRTSIQVEVASAEQRRSSTGRSSYGTHARRTDEAEPSLDNREGGELQRQQRGATWASWVVVGSWWPRVV